MSLFSPDICPKCGCNNAPMVWLGDKKGWLCEDCYDKQKKSKATYHIISCVYTKNKHNYVSECGHRALSVKGWNWCPFCGRVIRKLWNIKEDEE